MSCSCYPLIRIFAVVGVAGAVALAGAQTTLYVDDDAPNDPGPHDAAVSDPAENGSAAHPYDAVQEAIDASVDGDEVVLADGVYSGEGNRNLDFAGRSIVVRSASDDPERCIIDCQCRGRGFDFHSGETPAAVVKGLAVEFGMASNELECGDDGAGARLINSSPTISNCIFRSNLLHYGGLGAGLYCENSSPAVSDSVFIGNAATGSALGVIYCVDDSDLAMTNCIISDNHTTGLGCVLSDLQVVNCRISNNGGEGSNGAGVYCFWSNAEFINCTIMHNRSGAYGAGVYCIYRSYPVFRHCTIAHNSEQGVYSNGSDPAFVNCILWDNQPVEIDITAGAATVRYSDVRGGWPGAGNFDLDPLLERDGHLGSGSPCIDAGDPNEMQGCELDRDGEARSSEQGVDVGADELHDVDDDGLPDWWEAIWFETPYAAGPSGDEDGDGRSNMEEYVGRTNPHYKARLLYVDPAGDDLWDGLAPFWSGEHGPKATIQAAVDATDYREGDEVVLADGVYAGEGNRDVRLASRTVTVRSASNAPEACRIDCEGQGRGIYAVCGIDVSGTIKGVSIVDGAATEYSIGRPIGGGVLGYYGSRLDLENCIIQGCSADYGGGVYLYSGSSGRVRNCIICDNRAFYSGGGARCCQSESVFENCTISGNWAEGSGGGIIFYYCHDCVIKNSIVWGNHHGGSDTDEVGRASKSYSNFDDDIDGEGNVSVDPMFVDPDGPDDDPNTWEDNDYHLSPDSPCIDAGDPADFCLVDQLDIDGQRRIWDGDDDAAWRIDMGVDEYASHCPGDLNGDGAVDMSDLGALLAYYGGEELTLAEGDSDCDGDVDLADLAFLLSEYGATCGAGG